MGDAGEDDALKAFARDILTVDPKVDYSDVDKHLLLEVTKVVLEQANELNTVSQGALEQLRDALGNGDSDALTTYQNNILLKADASKPYHRGDLVLLSTAVHSPDLNSVSRDALTELGKGAMGDAGEDDALKAFARDILTVDPKVDYSDVDKHLLLEVTKVV